VPTTFSVSSKRASTQESVRLIASAFDRTVAIDQPYEETAPACVWFDRLQLNNNDKLKIGRVNAIRLLKLKLPIEPNKGQ
jgi:predicted TIM-barrel fold metal-dependent hydrolase